MYKKNFLAPCPDPKSSRSAFTKKKNLESNWKGGKYSASNCLKLSSLSINVIQFNKQNNTAIVAGDSGKLWIVDTSGPALQVDEFGSHSQIVWNAKFINDDTQIISSGYDCKIKIWDVQTKNCIKEVPNNHSRGIWEIIHKDGKIYTTGNDGTVRHMDLETGQELSCWKLSSSFVWNLLPLWSRELLVASSQDSTIHFLDYRVENHRASWKAEEQLTQVEHNDVSWPDLLVTGDSQGQVYFMDIRNISSSSISNNIRLANLNHIYLHPFNIRNIAFDGTKLMVAAKDKMTRGYDMKKLMSGESQISSAFPWVVQDLDTYCLEMSDSQLMIGTKVGELCKFDFGKPPVGFFDGLVAEGVSVVQDCNIM